MSGIYCDRLRGNAVTVTLIGGNGCTYDFCIKHFKPIAYFNCYLASCLGTYRPQYWEISDLGRNIYNSYKTWVILYLPGLN